MPGGLVADLEGHMVNIHHNEPMAPVPDGGALALFERQWTIYQAFVDNDYAATVGAYGTLHRLLKQAFGRPFSFLDLACGDARGSVAALEGTAVAHYHGVDLAPPALERAARNLEALDCEVELEHGDFIEAICKRPEPADVVWIGMSLHHLTTAEKLELMRAIRRMISMDGLFLTHEPTCMDGEDRDGYLDRLESVARSQFTALTSEELDAIITHVRAADYPETVASWEKLGRDAGFANTENVFTGARNLMRMFCFSVDPS